MPRHLFAVDLFLPLLLLSLRFGARSASLGSPRLRLLEGVASLRGSLRLVESELRLLNERLPTRRGRGGVLVWTRERFRRLQTATSGLFVRRGAAGTKAAAVALSGEIVFVAQIAGFFARRAQAGRFGETASRRSRRIESDGHAASDRRE